MIRRVAGLFLQIWILVVSACRKILGRKVAKKQQEPGESNEQWRVCTERFSEQLLSHVYFAGRQMGGVGSCRRSCRET